MNRKKMNEKYESYKMANTNLTMGCRSSRMVVGMVLHYNKIEKKLEEILHVTKFKIQVHKE